MPRSRAVLTAPIVIAIVLVGVFAIRSRGAETGEVTSPTKKNCAPVARGDVAAAKPGAPISIDVLANDVDADGDPLVFQVLKATGGAATVDDGGTPFDPDDDRVLFTPMIEGPGRRSVLYQAVDPDGAISQALVSVVVSAEGTLPEGVMSEAASAGDGRCGATRAATTTTATVDARPAPTAGGRGPARATTRPRDNRQITPTTRASSSTNTTRLQTTTTKTPSPPTTQPSGPPPTTPRRCGPPPTSGSDAEEQRWEQCVRDNS
ncbi:MAG TPA: hypothetical protein VMZ22_10985 [Acidimicrobiales bacterium]|nr:hypothetical protein [Acidimicrobiales bacterium]